MTSPHKTLKTFVRFFQTVKPHVPLIKFRKSFGENESQKSQQHESSGLTGKKVQRVTRVLEDYHLPNKYRRQPIDEIEIAAINSGGVF